MADTWFERAFVGRRRQGAACRLGARLLVAVFCFVLATAFDLFARIKLGIEEPSAHTRGGAFVAAAEAGRRHKRNRDGFRGDDGDGLSWSKNLNSKGGSEAWPQAKNGEAKPDGDGRFEAKSVGNKSGEEGVQGKNGESKPDSDDRSQGSARNADAAPDRSARNAGSSGLATNAGPPKTVAEAVTRFVKWMQPKPPAMPAWPEAKVTRAPRGDSDPPPSPGKPVPNAQAARKPAGRIAPGIALPDPATYRPNELLVLNANPAVLSALTANGWQKVQDVARGRGAVRFVSETADPVLARANFASQFREARFGLNHVYDLASDGDRMAAPDTMGAAGSCDPQRCYGPDLIKWRPYLAACAAGVKIGVVDTSIDGAHPALAWKKLDVRRRPGHQATNSEPHSHGTGIVSLLTGHPKSGTPGLVPTADYVIAEAFYTNRFGKPESDTDHLLWALDEMERAGAQIVNKSIAGPEDELVHKRLIELSRKNVVFVAAAGNGGPKALPAYPAAYKNEVIAVTAVGRDQRLFKEANRGDYIDVAAPGVRIWTAVLNNKHGMQSGTSLAAPFVTAIIAAIYKKALLPAFNRADAVRAPEAVTLAHLSAEQVVHNETVGLVRAPSNCTGEPSHVPTARLAPAIEFNRWETRVEYVSAKGGN